MEVAFGNLWQSTILIKPKQTRPFWTLKELFKCFKKHWISVFSQIGLKISHQKLFDDLNSFVCKRTFWDNLNDDEKRSALDISSKILTLFQLRPYGSAIQSALILIDTKMHQIAPGMKQEEKPPQFLRQRHRDLQNSSHFAATDESSNQQAMLTDVVRGPS
jgi:hypothetical protein